MPNWKIDWRSPVHPKVRMTAIAILAIVTLIALLAPVISPLLVSATTIDAATQRRLVILEDQQETLDLATEFGFDPMIVHITRKLSADAFKKHYCACPTWRFIRTERDLSYTLLSLVQAESRGDPKAFNPAGKAFGLTQLLLSTARQYDHTVQEGDLLTIPTNLHIAMEHFVSLLEDYRGNYTLAVIAWNKGEMGTNRLVELGGSDGGYARTVFTQAAMRNSK